jgi:hypothetical protein
VLAHELLLYVLAEPSLLCCERPVSQNIGPTFVFAILMMPDSHTAAHLRKLSVTVFGFED